MPKINVYPDSENLISGAADSMAGLAAQASAEPWGMPRPPRSLRGIHERQGRRRANESRHWHNFIRTLPNEGS
jgi:hypothetical protein